MNLPVERERLVVPRSDKQRLSVFRVAHAVKWTDPDHLLCAGRPDIQRCEVKRRCSSRLLSIPLSPSLAASLDSNVGVGDEPPGDPHDEHPQ